MDQAALWEEGFPKRDNKVLFEEADRSLFVIAGTGPRSVQTMGLADKFTLMTSIDTVLREARAIHGPHLVVLSGMAEGFDKALARAALNLGIKLWCAIPNPTYGEYYWGKHSITGQSQIKIFNDMLDQAWRVTIVCETIKVRGVHSNFIRNTFMKKHCDLMLVLPSDTGGTADMIKKLGKKFPQRHLEWP